jgi:hypothetical protein
LKDHKIWQYVDLDIDDPLNRVLLPIEKDGYLARSKHSGAHTKANRVRISDELDIIIRQGELGHWSKAEYNKAFQIFLLEERKGLIEGTIDLYADRKKKGK